MDYDKEIKEIRQHENEAEDRIASCNIQTRSHGVWEKIIGMMRMTMTIN